MSSNNQPLSGSSITPIQRVSLNSLLTSVVLDADAGNSSVLVKTGSTSSLYIDKFANVGINTTSPGSQLEVASNNGSCIRLRYGASTTAFADIGLTNSGDLSINPNTSNSNITTTASLNLTNHNGTTSGLKLNGTLVSATANQLNYTKVDAGIALPSKALVLDSNSTITGITSLTAGQIWGSIETAAQPNITSLGTLSSLTVTGNLNLNGSFILNGGSLTDSLGYVSGLTAGTGTALKALVLDEAKSISGITSIDIGGHDGGSIGLKLGGVLITASASELNYVDVQAGTGQASKALVLNSSRDIANINELTATKLGGTLQTATQPNITSLGTLTSLSVTGVLNATLATAAQPSITSVGTLTGLSISNLNNTTNFTTYQTWTNPIATPMIVKLDMSSTAPKFGTTSVHKMRFMTSDTIRMYIQTDGNVSIGDDINTHKLFVNGTFSATTIDGTLQTAAQPNITSVGTLTSLTVSGAISANQLTGTLQTATQPQITSLGTLSSLTVNNTIRVQNGTGYANIASSATGRMIISTSSNYANAIDGDILLQGSVIIGKDSGNNLLRFKGVTGDDSADHAVIGQRLYSGSDKSELLLFTGNDYTNVSGPDRIRLRAAEHRFQTYITDETYTILKDDNDRLVIANNGDVTISKKLIVSNEGIETTSLTLGGTLITSTAAELNYLDITTIGTAEASKALVLDANKDITDIRNLTALNLTGTLQTSAQSLITSVGTLTSLSVTGALNASGVTTLTNTTDATSTTSGGSLTVSGGLAVAKKLFVGERQYITNPSGGDMITLNASDVSSLATIRFINDTQSWELGSRGSASTPSNLINSFYIYDKTLSTTRFAIAPTTGYVGINQATPVSMLDVNGTITSTGLVVNGVNIGTTIASITGITAGTALASKALVLNASKNIDSINSLTSSILVASTTLTVAGVDIGSNILPLVGATAGSAVASKALVVNATKDISGINSLTSNVVNGALFKCSNIDPSSRCTIDFTNDTRSVELGLRGSLMDQPDSFYIYSGGGYNLVINSSGNMGIGGISSNSYKLNIVGSTNTTSLSINSTLITATAAQLNYLDITTAGTAQASKALVVDGNKDITDIRNLTATSIAGNISTAAQPQITSLGMLTSLSVSGALNATLATAAQPSITSVGTLSSLVVSGETRSGSLVITTPGALIYSEQGTSKFRIYHSSTEPAAIGSTSANDVYLVFNTNIRVVIKDIGTDIYNHNGSNAGLLLGGVLITATAAEINYLDITTIGSAQASKALVLNSSKNIDSINSLTSNILVASTTLTVAGVDIGSNILPLVGATAGSAVASKALIVDASRNIKNIRSICLGSSTDTARYLSILDNSMVVGGSLYGFSYGKSNQLNDQAEFSFHYADAGSTSNAFGVGFYGNPGIIKVYATKDVDIAFHDGTKGLKLGGTLITATATKLNYTDITTIGTAQASKALVVDANRDIANINALTATNLTGTLQTAAQPQITSLGTLSALTVSGETKTNNIVFTGPEAIVYSKQGASEFRIYHYTDGNFQIGSLSNNTLDLCSNSLIRIAIRGDGVTDIVDHDGSTKGLALGGTLITATAAEINYLDITTIGTAEASKALVLNASKNVDSINSLTSNILVASTTLTVAGVDIGSNILPLVGATAGSAVASKALVVDATKDIAGINSLSSTSLTSTKITTSSTLTTTILNGSYGDKYDLLLRRNATSDGVTHGIGFLHDNIQPSAVAPGAAILFERSGTSGHLKLLTGQTERFRISAAGNVGINNSNPTNALEVTGTIKAIGRLIMATDGEGLALRNAGGTIEMISRFDTTAGYFGSYNASDFKLMYSNSPKMTISASLITRTDNKTSFDTSSDRRIKEDIVDADTLLCYNFVKNVNLKYYKYKDVVFADYDGIIDKHTLGWIAQDVQQYFPKATSISSKFGIEDLLSLNVDDIYKSLYGCVQQIINDKESLESQVSTLKAENVILKDQLASIMRRLDALEN